MIGNVCSALDLRYSWDNCPATTRHIQSSAVITQSNKVRYCINNCRNCGRISIRCWIYQRASYRVSFDDIFLRKLSALWRHHTVLKSLQLIGRLRSHRMPDLHMNGRELTWIQSTRIVVAVMAARLTCPLGRMDDPPHRAILHATCRTVR